MQKTIFTLLSVGAGTWKLLSGREAEDFLSPVWKVASAARCVGLDASFFCSKILLSR
jgi:hypothetical protein